MSIADLAASDAADIASSLPSDQKMARLRDAAQRMVSKDAEVRALEAQLKAANAALYELRRKELPDIMMELGVDRVGLEQAASDLILEDYYRANISAEWPPEQREASFAYLEGPGEPPPGSNVAPGLDAGDLIKRVVSVSFGRGEEQLAEQVVAVLRTYLEEEKDTRDVVVTRNVPWNTLTAFVREQVQAGVTLDLDKLGAEVGKIVKIKPRREKR